MILVTGASGFVGRALCEELSMRGIAVRGSVRKNAGTGQIATGNLDGSTDWRAALIGCDTVVHAAARVHVMADNEADPILAYREVNVLATVNLARQAVDAGVKRFVYVSSVKVNGEETAALPFSSASTPQPVDPYGISKLEAERALFEIAEKTGLQVVVVRPPLVYGPGVKANFLMLMKLVRKGLPLPFGSIVNKRSMVALDNLIDLLILCTVHSRAPGNVFMVSDGADLGLAELVRYLADAMQRRVLLLNVPVNLIGAAGRLTGKVDVVQRLLGSLQVDIEHTRTTLDWRPPVTPQAGIGKTVRYFCNQFSEKQK